jgi:hypothetical protein
MSFGVFNVVERESKRRIPSDLNKVVESKFCRAHRTMALDLNHPRNEGRWSLNQKHPLSSLIPRDGNGAPIPDGDFLH